MNLLSTVFLWLSFAFCLSMTVGGMLVLFRVGRREMGPHYPLLQGVFILVSVFGFYGLWPRILLTYIGFDNADAVSALILSMGLPFLLAGFTALLLWSCRLQQRAALWPVLGAWGLSTLLALWQLNGDHALHEAVRRAWSAAGVVFLLLSLMVLSQGSAMFAVKRDQVLWLAGLAALGLCFASGLTPLSLLPGYERAFILVFFLLIAALPVGYVYRVPRAQQAAPEGFEAFLARHGISRREAQIIQGIYAGKTNQEIANSLFLSLQTVKDHTSRIYQKTFVKNRGQLTALLRDIL